MSPHRPLPEPPHSRPRPHPHSHAHGEPGHGDDDKADPSRSGATADAHDHDHDHDHGHGHGHGQGQGQGHSHAPSSFGRAFAIGIALNTAFVAIEAGYGFWAHSLALLADAGHNLSDVFGLALAWGATVLAARRPNDRFTYGLRASTILAALFNAVFLLIAVGAIAVEAVQRFGDPQPVAGSTVMVVAGIGVVINTVTALLFMSGRKGDLNIRAAFLHMAADAAISLGVVLSGFLITATAWQWIDPVTSLLIVVLIVAGTWGLLRDSVFMSLDAVPPGLDRPQVRAHLLTLPGVLHIHDLHIWSISTTEIALTAHLVRPSMPIDDDFLHEAAQSLRQRFGIGHATLQVECGVGRCALEPEEVV